MAFFQYIPLVEAPIIDKPRRDLRGSRAVEQYRISSQVLYIPVEGFSWKYLPLTAIRGVISGHVTETGESQLAPYSKDKPILRVIHENGAEVLVLESEKNQKLLKELLENPV